MAPMTGVLSHFTRDDRGFLVRPCPAGRRGDAYCQKKLCFTATAVEPVAEILYELSLRDDCHMVKLDAAPGRHGMVRGRCFLTGEAAVGELWRRYKVTDHVLCTVQDDDFTKGYR
jgi:hypothetical protein